MINFLKHYTVTLVLYIVCDLLWIHFIGGDMYEAHVHDLLASTPVWSAVIAFYLMYPLGLLLLAIENARSATTAALRGGLYGFCAYGTFSLTNQALLKDWAWVMTLSDMAWGTIMNAFLAFIVVTVFAKK